MSGEEILSSDGGAEQERFRPDGTLNPKFLGELRLSTSASLLHGDPAWLPNGTNLFHCSECDLMGTSQHLEIHDRDRHIERLGFQQRIRRVQAGPSNWVVCRFLSGKPELAAFYARAIRARRRAEWARSCR